MCLLWVYTALLWAPQSQEWLRRCVRVGPALAPAYSSSRTWQVEKVFHLQMKSLKLAPGCPLLWWSLLGMGSFFSWNTTIWDPSQGKGQLNCTVTKKLGGAAEGSHSYHFVGMPIWALPGLCVSEISLILWEEKSFLPLSAQCQSQQL